MVSLKHIFCLGLMSAIGTCGLPATANGDPRPVAAFIVGGLTEARQIVSEQSDRYWAGFAKAPFGFLLVETDREVILCDGRTPDGFEAAVVAQNLDCPQAIGPRSWRQPSLLAAMPVFGPPSVIVMGSPETTGKTMPEWQKTIFHEHFHQWQAALPGYYQMVEQLNLSNGDQSGMWMLNFPFPYNNARSVAAHRDASLKLAAAVRSDAKQLRQRVKAYLAARARFSATVSEREWRYFEFQLWQEGVARWTEIVVAESSGREQIVAAAQDLRNSVMAQLEAPDLRVQGRIAAYALGAGEAMLLERTTPNWRHCYTRKLALKPILLHGCNLARQ
jgi:hypothetical protein